MAMDAHLKSNESALILSISLWPSVTQSDAPLIYCRNHYTRNMFNYKVHWNRDFRGQILPGIYDYLTPQPPNQILSNATLFHISIWSVCQHFLKTEMIKNVSYTQG